MEDDLPYEITISNAFPHALDDDTLLIKAVGATLRQHGAVSACIHLALVSDEQIAKLNGRHLQHEGPTDVLTFDMREGVGAGAGEGEAAPNGEIVVSVETAAREAALRRHPIESELALYAVHGTLHLLGYDDQEAGEAEAMHVVEDRILAALGLGAVYESGGE